MKKILVIGSRDRLDEFAQLELKNADVHLLDQFYIEIEQLEVPLQEAEVPQDEYFMEKVEFATYDIIFDLNLDENPDNLDLYADNEGQVVFGCAVTRSLLETVETMAYELDCTVIGMNAFPTFINRSRLEFSLLEAGDATTLAATMEALGLEYEVVDDRVGMVTPRIICMIINEACFVLGEGTGTVEGVDRAMKLGTNYPKGPFEWSDQMGIHNVFTLLTALRMETGEEKYKMAPELKKRYLRGEPFYAA